MMWVKEEKRQRRAERPPFVLFARDRRLGDDVRRSFSRGGVVCCRCVFFSLRLMYVVSIRIALYTVWWRGEPPPCC